MLLSDFETAVEDHGTDLTDWPVGLRDAAQALLDSSAEARQFLADEIALDGALSAAMAPVKAPAGLTDRIVLKASLDGAEPARPYLRLVEAATTQAPRPVAPVRTPEPAWQRAVNWLREHSQGAGLRYGVAFALCFSIGLGVSMLLASPDETNYPNYVSGLYADLAY